MMGFDSISTVGFPSPAYCPTDSNKNIDNNDNKNGTRGRKKVGAITNAPLLQAGGSFYFFYFISQNKSSRLIQIQNKIYYFK
jgi:hypothetical protein